MVGGVTETITHGVSKMKLLSTLLSTLLIIGLSTSCATVVKDKTYSNYTYDGDYNPAVFMEWDIIATEYYTDGGYNFVQHVLSNPDINSSVITIVAICVYDNEGGVSLIAYGYNKNGVDYVYVLDVDKNHYGLWLSRPSIGNIHKF